MRSITPAHIFLLLSFPANALPIHAQKDDRAFIDSLIAREASQGEDTNKLNTLRLLVDSISDPIEQAEYIEQLGALSETLSRSGVPAIRRKGELGRAKYLLVLARQKERNGYLVQALGHFEECMEILKQGGDPATFEEAATKGGRIAFRLGDYPKAMAHFERSYRLAEQRGSVTARFDHFNRLASLYESQGDLEKTLEYDKEQLAEAERLQDAGSIALALVNLASVHEVRGELDRAMELAQQAYAMEFPGKGRKIIGASLNVIGRVHAKRGEYGQAEEAFIGLLETYEEMGLGIQSQGALISLARVHLAQGRLTRALERGEEALAIGQQLGNPGHIADAAEVLEEIYKNMGRSADALEMADLQLQLRDSLDQTTTIQALARYEYQKRFIADSLLQVNARAATAATHAAAIHAERNRRNLFLFSGIGVLLVAGGLWKSLRSTRRSRTLILRQKEEADELRARAEQSERAKHQFLANMSHEIRTPMNAIMGMTGILQRKDHPVEQDRYLNAIAQSSGNLLVILNDILDLSKIVAGKFEQEEIPFEPREVIGNVKEILQFKAEEKGLTLELDMAADLPRSLIGDPTRLQQVLLNLAGNAIKFTDKGGVTIRAKATEVAADQVTLTIHVIDTGIGIPEDKQEKIFLEFDQAYSDTTRKYGGTGLGLAISKRLVEMRGGTITVQSKKDKGSTFTVTIPYAIASAPQNEPDVSTAAALKDLRILLAEDNAFNTIVAQDELADAIPGVQVDVAINGRKALAMVQANTYDVVLMDIQMPEMNGYDATRAIRALGGDRSKIPIIAMTATVMQAELELCREAGMNGHIPKPFTREELMKSIAAVINA